MRPVAPALGALLLLLLQAVPCAQAAPAQTVYRCGPDGRVYSQSPCADGKPLSVEDPRSAIQQKAARDVAKRDADHASQLADERRQREAAVKGQRAAGFMTAPQAASAASSAKADKRRSRSAKLDPRMSPPMRVPAAASAPR